ncbi:hypothetical protein GBAR_LOCUS11360 [Geodia barretti]|uniref:Calx-beta domain-containing protein n=1 Tax=Geodia barretti TaxID=519541 RepID=A0AA35RXJ9_GEOBA|nr:hypothetical protein GBAR_LOCUS11360 [Geodia barretti]
MEGLPHKTCSLLALLAAVACGGGLDEGFYQPTMRPIREVINSQPDISFCPSTISVHEGVDAFATISLCRQSNNFHYEVVWWPSTTVTVTSLSGSATAGSDFISTPISVTFGNFDTEVPFSVTILNDSFIERNETFTLALSNGNTATVTIVDEDGKFTTASV